MTNRLTNVRSAPVEPHSTRSRTRSLVACLLAAIALVLALDAGYLHAKAWLAQVLLREAWAESQSSGAAHKPWPWADTHPVARLAVPAHGVEQIVLAGDAGRTLAFGPGWAESSALPGTRGTPVISGHRDTHFAFLEDLAVGDAIELDGARGRAMYRVVDTQVVDSRDHRIAPGAHDGLLLVTCWPFDAVAPGGPLRYVVRAERVDAATLAFN